MKRLITQFTSTYFGAEERLAHWMDSKLTTDRLTRITMLTFGFIFVYFGIQKFAVFESPPQAAVRAFMFSFSIDIVTLSTVMMFIGLYEVFMGVLFLSNEHRLSALLFIPHQLTGFVLLFLLPAQYFNRAGVISIVGVDIYWGLTSWSAFVFKNLIFICAFLLITKHYLSEEYDPQITESD